nr:bifunctional phosphopantothenoylcysteine decarboxylase/phosphopantothenate--cysteine ligase CoaBC [uncultured Capnocytophaga sp.]
MKNTIPNLHSLKGKKILVGITAGIAAYKIPNLIRLLVKEQASVKVIMTPDAQDFVTPFTLSVLSKNKVYIYFDTDDHQWNNHVELAMWADAFLIAPLTANTLSKMATGGCDNLLLATYLSAKCPVFFAPAMDLDMYEHPSTQRNIALLESYGNIHIPSEYGELASGLVGKGRMASEETLKETLCKFFFDKKDLFLGKKILITAGPTYEMMDPVRFIGNFSSGKMGVALANMASLMGAEVSLVLGPTPTHLTEDKVKVHHVVSASEMYEVTNDEFIHSDIAILAAAVADYTPKEKAPQKIKKKTNNLQLELIKTQDILASLGQRKTSSQCLIGFALETQDELANAKGKLTKKNLDAIVLNSLNDKGAGFGTDTNKVTFITQSGKEKTIPLMSKTEIAIEILLEIHQEFFNHNNLT